MTNKDTFFSLKEAQKLTNKSVRTLRRYIDKLDKIEDIKKATLTRKEGKRVMVSQKFIDFVKLGGKDLSKFIDKEDSNFEDFAEPTKQKGNSLLIETLQKNVERLELRNDELYKSIQEKDNQIKEKDQDFKMLTSKVITLQDELKSIEAPKDKEEPNKQEVQKEPQSKKPNTLDYIMTTTMVLLVMAFIVFVIIVLLETNK